MSKIYKNFSLFNYLYTKANVNFMKLSSGFCNFDKIYDELVTDTALFFQEFSTNNSSYEYFYLYNYMLKHGYFSSRPFKLRTDSPNYLAGPVVMSGRGNSHHINSFYYDILQAINENGDKSILASKILVEDSYFLDFIMQIIDSKMALLVLEGESYSIQDPANKLIYSTHDLLETSPKFCCDSVLKHENIGIYLESFMAYSGISKEALNYHLQNMNESKSISVDELKDIKTKVKKLCKSRESELCDFHDRNLDKIEEIARRVKNH